MVYDICYIFLGELLLCVHIFLGELLLYIHIFLGELTSAEKAVVSIGNELHRINVSLNVLLHHIPNLLQNHNKFGMGEGERLGMMEK